MYITIRYDCHPLPTTSSSAMNNRQLHVMQASITLSYGMLCYQYMLCVSMYSYILHCAWICSIHTQHQIGQVISQSADQLTRRPDVRTSTGITIKYFNQT